MEAKFLIHDLLCKINDAHTSNEERRRAEDQLTSL